MKYLADILTFPRDARRAWCWSGGAGVWEELRARTIARVVRLWRATVLEIDLIGVPLTAPPPGVEIRPLAEGDDAALAAAFSHRAMAPLTRARALGRGCLVAWRARTPVGYFLWSEGPDPELEARGITVPPGIVYVWYLAVARRERGRRIGLALLHWELAEACAHRAAHKAWMAVGAGNRRALAVAQRFASGSRVNVLGQVWSFKVLRWSRVLFRPRGWRAAAVRTAIVGGEVVG